MKTSANGLQFVTDNEGVVLHPYNDVAGYLTIGVGHLIKEGEEFPDHITQEQAMELLASDVERFENAVNSYGLDLTQNQFDALVDFAFNCGEGALEQLLAHGVDDVPNQLPKWTHAGGRVVGALVRRREAEVELWQA